MKDYPSLNDALGLDFEPYLLASFAKQHACGEPPRLIVAFSAVRRGVQRTPLFCRTCYSPLRLQFRLGNVVECNGCGRRWLEQSHGSFPHLVHGTPLPDGALAFDVRQIMPAQDETTRLSRRERRRKARRGSHGRRSAKPVAKVFVTPHIGPTFPPAIKVAIERESPLQEWPMKRSETTDFAFETKVLLPLTEGFAVQCCHNCGYDLIGTVRVYLAEDEADLAQHLRKLALDMMKRTLVRFARELQEKPCRRCGYRF